jgi:hypothetical protein
MVVQAMGGLMSVTGEPEGEPQKVRPASVPSGETQRAVRLEKGRLVRWD